MMLGEEDARIQQYFIDNAFPKEHQINQLLSALEQNDDAVVYLTLNQRLIFQRVR